MALVSGFLRQKCRWIKRPQVSDEFDNFGQPITPEPVEIKCRWEYQGSLAWIGGKMGDGSGKTQFVAKALVVDKVEPGDVLEYEGKSYSVIARSTIVDASGREQGRTCYV